VPLKIQSTSKKCKCCGTKLHCQDQCPAKDAECHKCKKKDHFSNQCLSKRVEDVTSHLQEDDLWSSWVWDSVVQYYRYYPVSWYQMAVLTSKFGIVGIGYAVYSVSWWFTVTFWIDLNQKCSTSYHKKFQILDPQWPGYHWYIMCSLEVSIPKVYRDTSTIVL